ncbi:Leucyl-tRNA synthetase, mitochondrial, partial [Ascosphaera atra]
MDTFVDSSWYALRFLDAHNTAQLFGKDKVRPVDTYVGGVEHAILHLLYAKFVYKFLATQTDLFPPEKRGEGEVHEPFTTLLSQGMVHGKTFTDPATGRFLKPDELDFSADAKNPVIKGREGPVRPNVSYEKMSKSKYNGVDPTACIERFGADSVRAHVLFSAPVSEVLEWEEGKIVGVQRWFGRVWKVVGESVGAVEGEVGKVVQVLGQVKTEDAIKQVLTDLHTQLPAIKDLTDAEADVLLVTHTTIASVSD